MLPDELFFQITNLDGDISFGGNLKAELIDNCQEVVLDITSAFFINEFTDIKGIKQIAYEFGNIGIDFHFELLYLKISHTTSDAVWYSAPFLITENLKEETTRFDYKNQSYFNGISYDRANYFQSIRLQCFKNDVDVSSQSSEYTQLSGKVISLRKITTYIDKYKFYTCDFFTFFRTVVLLNHDIIYIDGKRISNKPQTTKSERVVDSNFFELDFEANPTEEKRTFLTQLNIIIPVCDLAVSNISASLLSSTMTANWTNSATPYAILFEISTDGQATWNAPTGLVFSMPKNSATYNDPAITHHIRITPKCTVDSVGMPSVYLFTNTTASSCVIPNLVSATKNASTNDVVYNWDNNGYNYTTGTAQLQYSLDSGTNWTTIGTPSSSALTATVNIGGVTLGQAIQYRIICNGNNCNNQISNVISTTFGTATSSPSASYSNAHSLTVSPTPGNNDLKTESGILTITGGIYRIRSSAGIYTNNGTLVSCNLTIGGVSMHSEAFDSTTTNTSSNWIDLGPGTYPYTLQVEGSGNGGSGIGSIVVN